MPMQLTVTRNRKASENYNSEGHGISLTVELDQGLLNRPEELQQQVARLYREADAALDQQVEKPPQRSARPSNGQRRNGNGRNGGSMTQSQRRAIEAIARRCQIDPADEARDIVGAELDELTLRQASELIDHLKSLQPTSDGR